MVLWSSIRGTISLVAKSVQLVFFASKAQTSLLLFTIICQGLLPVVAASLSASVLDAVVHIKEIGARELLELCAFWGFALFMYDLISPAVLFLQSNIADKTLFEVNRTIIAKSNSLKGLELYERPDFQNDIEILTSQAHHRPIHLVVTIVGLLRDLVVVLGCVVVLLKYISWIVIIPLTGALIH